MVICIALVTAGALLTPASPLLRRHAVRSPRTAREGALMMIKIAKSADSFDNVQKDLLGRLGLDDDAEDDDDNVPIDDSELAETASAISSSMDHEPTPRSGTQEWGQWSHEGDNINLDLTLPEGTRAKELSCTVSKEGIMCVARQGEDLLVGKLALPVDRTELAWLVEEQDDGSKLLSIEVPMLAIDTSSRMTSVDCIFDESLVVNGQPCLAPGLSAVGGKHARTA